MALVPQHRSSMQVLIVAIALIFSVQGRSTTDQETWQQFKIQYGKTYRSLLEDLQRFSIFRSNLRAIEEHNKRYARGEESFSMRINQFGDMTQEEFEETLVLQRTELDGRLPTYESFGGDIPENLDWRKLGAVTEVKDQGPHCGSCWAFSAVGAIEGQVFIHKKIQETFSPQNLVDCAKGAYNNHGCLSGEQTEAFRYVKDHGILTEKEYPYKGVNGTCLKEGGLKISDFKKVPIGDEIALTNAIAIIGPIAASLDSSGLQFYAHGVLDSSHCKSTYRALNHAVVLVGYEKNYYIAKNSWGKSWGDNGYFNILRNNNTCGIALDNTYPVL